MLGLNNVCSSATCFPDHSAPFRIICDHYVCSTLGPHFWLWHYYNKARPDKRGRGKSWGTLQKAFIWRCSRRREQIQYIQIIVRNVGNHSSIYFALLLPICSANYLTAVLHRGFYSLMMPPECPWPARLKCSQRRHSGACLGPPTWGKGSLWQNTCTYQWF